MTGLAELLEGRRVCVCGGAGGVGKTTTSAAIALGMAARGARVAVVTIDPARRLADALGVGELDNGPARVDPERLAAAGIPMEGELWAMMLDSKRTFDELIDRVAPDPDRAAQVKANSIYRELSTAVSGSQEFTAIAKLHELAETGEWDLLVLDTPPSRNALDFLDAPGRITAFLEGRALRAFIRPTGLGMRVLGLGASPLLSAMRRVTGVDLVGDLIAFFGLLGDMTEAFHRRAADVGALLAAPTTAFLLVTSPETEPVAEGIWFHRTLLDSGLPFAGAIVNRVTTDPGPGELPELPGVDRDLHRRLGELLDDARRLAARDARNLTRLREELGGAPMVLIPRLDDDVHDLAGLDRVRRHLFP